MMRGNEALVFCVALTAACGEGAPDVPLDPGPVRDRAVDDRIREAAREISGAAADDVVTRSLGLLERQADEQARATDVVREAVAMGRELSAATALRPESVSPDLAARLGHLVEVVGRRYHLDAAGLAGVRERLTKLGAASAASQPLQRAATAAATHLARMAKLHGDLTALDAALRAGELEAVGTQAAVLVQALSAYERQPEISSSELTYIGSPLTGGPLTTGVPATGVTAAYQAGASSTVPQVDDTRSAEEVDVTPEIYAKAVELGGDPVALYELVKNEFTLELYHGVLKGAPDTFRQRRGGPADLAAVLIALLRAAEIPARYVTGVIRLERGRLEDWVGTSEERLLLQAVSASGLAHEPVYAGGRLSAVKLGHVWVEAYVPYGHYRGVPLGQAAKEWVALDPGIAGLPRHARTAGALGDPLGELGVSAQGLYEDYLGTVQAKLPLGVVRERLEAALAAQGQATSYEALLDQTVVRPEALGVLPASLPYRVEQVTGEHDFLPSAYVQRLRLVARAGATVLLEWSAATYQLVGHRVVLAYASASPEDEAVIVSFGGQLETPAYLARVVPVVRVDGREVARGSEPLGLGERHDLLLEIVTAGGVTRRLENEGLAGNLYALALGAPRNELTEPVDPEASDLEPEAGRLLSEVARAYVNGWTEAEEELARLLGVRLIRPVVSEVLVSNQIAVQGELGVPLGLAWRGVRVDADLRAATVLRTRAGAAQTAASDLRLLSGLHGSALERQALTDAFVVEAVSADKALAAAREAGIAVLHIDSGNLGTELPKLSASGAVVADIEERARRGQQVTVHAQPVTRQAWRGTGYIARHPASGETAYLLSGEVITSGGLTIVPPSAWPPEMALKAQNSSSAPPVDVSEITAGALEIVGSMSARTIAGLYDDKEVVRFLVRATSQDGRPVKGAALVLESFAGTPGCSPDKSALAAFASELRRRAEDVRSHAPSEGPFEPRPELNATPRPLAQGMTNNKGIVSFYCVSDPSFHNSFVLLPTASGNGLEMVGQNLLRVVWTDYQQTNRLVYPVALQILAHSEQPGFLEKSSPRGAVEEPTDLVSRSVFQVRLVDIFGNPLGGQQTLWSSSVAADVVVDPAQGSLTAPVALGTSVTNASGGCGVRLYVGEASWNHLLTARAAAAPMLRQVFEVVQRVPPSADQELEVRLVHSRTDRGWHGVSGTLAPVESRFVALARRVRPEPAEPWTERTGRIAVQVVDPLTRQPLELGLGPSVDVGAVFRLPYRPDDLAVQVLMYWPEHLEGVADTDLPLVAVAEVARTAALPRLSAERVLPGNYLVPLMPGGLALASDAGIRLLVRNPADYELRATISDMPDVGENEIVSLPDVSVARRYEGRSWEFAIDPSDRLPLATVTEPEAWTYTWIQPEMRAAAGAGGVVLRVLPPTAEQPVSALEIFVGRAVVHKVGPEPVLIDDLGRTRSEVTVSYELQVPAGFAFERAELEIGTEDENTLSSFDVPSTGGTLVDFVIPQGTNVGTGPRAVARLRINPGSPWETESTGRVFGVATFGIDIFEPPLGTRFAIDAEAQMPVVGARARIVGRTPDPTPTTEFEWRAEILFDARSESDPACSDAPARRMVFTGVIGKTLGDAPLTASFPVVRGGDLTLVASAVVDGERVEVRAEGYKITAHSPLGSAVAAALPHATLRRIANLESGGCRQFNELGGPMPNICPLWSGDQKGGVGIMQLTVPTPSDDEVWSWRANVAGGIRVLNSKWAGTDGYPGRVTTARRFLEARDRINVRRAQDGLPPLDIYASPFESGGFEVDVIRQLERDIIRGYNGWGGTDEFGFELHEYEVLPIIQNNEEVIEIDDSGRAIWTFVDAQRRMQRWLVAHPTRPVYGGDIDYVDHVLARQPGCP